MKNKRFSFSSLLHNNKFVFGFSIVTSVVIWLAVSYSVNTRDTVIIPGVPVVVNTDTPALGTLGLDVVGGHDLTVSVEIVCKRYQRKLIRAEDIQATADLSSVTAPGGHDIKIVVTKAAGSNYDFTIKSVAPGSVQIIFDRVKTVEVAVTAKAVGAAAAGGLSVENAQLADAENNTVTVEGPESTVNRIVSAAAVAQINKTLPKTDSFSGDIVLYDAAGKEIDQTDLILSFTKARITVPISKRKTVPVVPVFTNIPEAYKSKPISNTLSVDQVTVSGPPDIIDGMTQLVLEPIDFGEITPGAYRFTRNINPPAGVKVTDSSISQVRVTISSRNLSSKKLTITKFSFVGLPADKKAQVVTEQLADVTLAGVRSSVNALRSTNVYAELDLSDKPGDGEYEVVAKIRFSSHKDVWAVNPAAGQYTVFVKIS